MKRITFSLILFFELFIRFPLSAASPRSADFLIIERPQALTVFNEFQRSMSDAQKTALGPFMPLQIISDNAYLGDDITPVLKGQSNGKFYFLLQDNDRRIINRVNAGLVKRYRRCAVLGDTVRITRDGVRLFAPRSPGLRTMRQLEKNQLLQLIFKKRGYIYARLLADKSVYGWLAASDARHWRKVRAPAGIAKTPFPNANLKERILNRFIAANYKYRLLFSHFGKKESAPQWQETAAADKLIFHLQPPELAKDLRRSTQILLRDVQGELIGSDWQARYERGQIIIESSKTK